MTPLPHNFATEQHVLSVCLKDGGETYQRAKDAGIAESSFHDPRHALIWRTLGQVSAPDLSLLFPAIPTDRIPPAYLLEIDNVAPTTAHAGEMIAQLSELTAKRQLIRQATELIEHAGNGTSLDELAEQAKAMVPNATGKTTILAELLSRRVTAANPPKEPITRLYLADKPIATPGNLQTITAKSKAGKTVATGAATAAVIVATTGTTQLRDTFKFRASNPQGHAVIIIDTEQSPYDAWTCYQRILARAGETTDPKWLLHFALVGYSVSKRKKALAAALEYAKKTFGGVFLVIIDGVAHFVSSVNELEECNELADWLRELSVTYDTAMLCVIHSNEGDKAGNDSRGHLGKQLTRDAESNLLLKKEGEITTITSDKQRKAPITEADQVAFKWDDAQQRHASCATSGGTAKTGRPAKYQFSDVASIFPKPDQKGMTRNVAFRYASEICPVKETAFREIILKAVRDGELLATQESGVFYYRLPV